MNFAAALRLTIGMSIAVACYSLHAGNKDDTTKLHCEGILSSSDNVDFGTTEAVFELQYDGRDSPTYGFLNGIIGVTGEHVIKLNLDTSSLTGEENPAIGNQWLGIYIGSVSISRVSGRFQLTWVAQKSKDSGILANAMWSGVCTKVDPPRNKF